MAAKKSSQNSNSMAAKVMFSLLIFLGIYLVVMGVLSGESDNWRAFMMATGLAFFAAGTIGRSNG